MSGFFIVLLALCFVGGYVESRRIEGCLPNSTASLCGQLCESTCDRPEILYCFPANPKLCPIECRCIEGYVRDRRTGLCVLLRDCSNRKKW